MVHGFVSKRPAPQTTGGWVDFSFFKTPAFGERAFLTRWPHVFWTGASSDDWQRVNGPGNVAALFTDLDVDKKGFVTLQEK